MEEIKPKKERKFLKAMGDIALTLFRELVLGIGKKVINKVGNKRQGLVISFIIIASTFAIAQFPNTTNKQRLGFQTTGDGLVWRGSLSDTASIQPINNQNAWVILDTINLKFYTFDFTSNIWNLVGGAAFTQPVDSLFFNVNVPTNNVDTAKMRWDSDLATVVLGLNDNIPNELGFKNFWLVKNQTGSTITKGSLVYANGTVGASGRITVDKFIANGSIDAKYLLGITAHDLTDGEDGYVISFGKIRQVNTDTFAAGAILYPSPTVAGVWTDVEPVAPNLDMPIGFCINSSANNGTIAIRVASGYKLSELHDVAISSPVEKSSLYYSGGLWRDTTAALLVSDTASMLANYATKAYADTTGRLYARQDFTNVSYSTLTWTQSDTLIPGGVTVVQVYRNGQILLPSQYTIPTSTSVVIAASSFKVNDNYTVIFPRGGGAGSGGGSGSLTSISGGTGILVSPDPITTTGTVSADLSVLMELTDTSLLNLTSRFASKLNTTDTASLSNRIDAKGNGTVTSVGNGYGLLSTQSPITTSGVIRVDSNTVYNYVRDSIVKVRIGNDTIKILKQEYNNVTTDTLTWTTTNKFPIQLRAFILLFRNGQLLINDQYSVIDTNKIKVAATSYKVGENYTLVTVSGIGSAGVSQTGNPVYPEAGIALSTGTTWATSIPNNSSNWNTAFTDRLKWDGGSTGLTPSTGRTSLGGTTIGQSMFTLTNPSTISFPRFNADNTVTSRSAANFRTDIGAGTVTSVNVAAGTPLSIQNNTTIPEISMSAATGSVNGYLTSTDWTTFNNKENTITAGTTGQYFRGDKTFHTLDKSAVGLGNVDNTSDVNKPVSTATQTALNLKVNVSDTASMLTPYFRDADTSLLNLTSRFATKLNTTDTASLSNRINAKGNGTVTSVNVAAGTPMSITNNTTTPEISMPAASASVSGYLQATAFSLFQSKQGTISLTSTGSSGASTFDGSTLNIPNYTLSGLGGVPTSRTITINGTSQDLSANRIYNVGTVTSVGGTGTVSGLTLTGSVTGSGNLTLGGTLSLTSSNVTTALGYTPYNSTNPNGYITNSSLSSYLPLTGGTLTGGLTGTNLNLNAGIDASGNFSTSYHTNVSALFRGYQILVAPNNDYGSTKIHFPNRPVTESFSDFGSGIRHKWAGSDARNSFLSLYTSNNLNLQIDAVSIDASGNVGIRDTTPSYTLDVNGTFNATNAATLGSTLAVTGTTTLSNLAGTGTRMVVAASDGLLSTQAIQTERYYINLGIVAGAADNSASTYDFTYGSNIFIVPTSLNGYCIDSVYIRAIGCSTCPPVSPDLDYYVGVYKANAGARVTTSGATLVGSQITMNEYDLNQVNRNDTLLTGEAWWVYLNGTYTSDMAYITAGFVVKKLVTKKNINMKQLLFLLLFPCFAIAQYQGNGNQKITLGEQTTADGLVWRGRLTDTSNLLTNKLDTSVYIVLDTGTRAMWYYQASTTPKWTRLVDSLNNLQGQLSLTSKVTDVLPVANGGTNRITMPAGYILHGDGTSVDTAIGLFWNRTSNRLGIGTNNPTGSLNIYNPSSAPVINIANGVVPVSGSEGGIINLYLGGTGSVTGNYAATNSLLGRITFSGYGNNFFYQGAEVNAIVSTGGNIDRSDHVADLQFLTKGVGPNIPTEQMRITGSGNVGIGTTTPAVQFHTTAGVRFAGLASITDLRTDADGDLFNGSDFNLKNSIDTINFGLSDVLKLKPVSFNWNNEGRNISEYKSMGFIAQDVMNIIPNAASTMGDGYMQVDYNAIVATLTKAIQEQQALIKALEQRILTLENK